MDGTRRSTAAQTLARFAASQPTSDLPAEVREVTTLHLLDTLGCALAASAMGVGTAPRDALLALHPSGEATVIGADRGLPAPAAACGNGTLAHALEFDDTNPAAIVNVGSYILPAALATAELVGASGADLLAALAVGAETTCRLGAAVAPSFLVSGFHPAAVCGVFGATAACARLLGLAEPAIVHALAVAGSLASGIYEHFADGSSTKMLHAGWTGQSAVHAALFAQAGLDGPPTVLEGRFGVLHSHFRAAPDAVEGHLEDLGQRWVSLQTSIKPYPVCYMSLSPLAALREAVGGRVLAAQDITQVRVSIPEAGVPIVLEPRADKLRPRTRYDAQFSLPFVLATMLLRGRVDLSTFEDGAIDDPEVLDVAGRVVGVAAEFDSFPQACPAIVEVETVDGTVHRARLDHEPGGPGNPLSAAQVRAKFIDNAVPALGPEGAQTLSEVVEGLDAAPDLQDLADRLAPRRLRQG